MIILLILITSSHDNVWRLLGENWSWSLLGLKGLNFTNIEAAVGGTKKVPRTILEEEFPVSRNTAASKIGNGVSSLLWHLRCHCKPDQNNFHRYLIQQQWKFFQIFVNSDVVYVQTWEVLTLATLILDKFVVLLVVWETRPASSPTRPRKQFWYFLWLSLRCSKSSRARKFVAEGHSI